MLQGHGPVRAALLLVILPLAGGAAAGKEALPSFFAFSPDKERTVDEALTPPEQEQLAASLRERDRLDGTTWRPEVDAQAHEQVVVALWDGLRTSRDPFDTARALELGRVSLPVPGSDRLLKDGIVLTRPAAGGAAPMGFAAWRERLAAWRAAGWTLAQSEWHHDEFHPEANPPWSFVKVDLQCAGPDGARVEFRGRLRVTWRGAPVPGAAPSVSDVDASQLVRLSRPASPGFREVFHETFVRGMDRGSTMLLAWDLAGTGRSDLVLPGVNVRYRNLGRGRFRREPFLAHPVYPDPCGVLADVDGDGIVDYLCAAGTPQRLLLYRGAAGGRFPGAPVPATADPLALSAGSVIAVGDADGDGHPDAWIGQYRNPYLGGEFPVPYDDANDGYPCYLLLNDGHGKFRDATATAGFDAKRNRRNYGASFLDLDGDGRPDLVTVSDFAGVDVWRNLGGGKFSDVTPSAVDDPKNFGMGLAVDDFARDGHLGFYVSGMGSTTMRRLQQMGLHRADRPEVSLTRTRMGYGSRMYLWDGPGRYRQPAWGDQVCRSGWSWGVVGFDPDLDGDRDLYVVNGFISGSSAADYCTRFWCHDVYAGREGSPRLTRHLLAVSSEPLNRGSVSWNGYEKNRFFMRVGATEYVEAAYPLGLALEQDCRNLVADDFDLDGRPDLALLYEEREAGGNAGNGKFGLKILRNELAGGHHWIGVRLKPGPGTIPIGAVMTLATPSGPRVAAVLAGDSWRSQQAALKIFGLGDDPRVDGLEVRWPDGRISRVDRPRPDRYVDVAPPAPR